MRFQMLLHLNLQTVNDNWALFYYFNINLKGVFAIQASDAQCQNFLCVCILTTIKDKADFSKILFWGEVEIFSFEIGSLIYCNFQILMFKRMHPIDSYLLLQIDCRQKQGQCLLVLLYCDFFLFGDI